MLTLLAGLLTVSAGSGSDWWLIATARISTPATAFFADRASIIRSGDRVTITEAMEAEAPRQPRVVVSRRDRVEYDCRAGTYRMLNQWAARANGRWYHIGRGASVRKGVDADGLRAVRMRFACGDTGVARQLVDADLRRQAREDLR